MTPLYVSYNGQMLYNAKLRTGESLYIVQDPAAHQGPQGYHVIWSPAQTPRELLQAAIDHDKKQDIRLTAVDVPNHDIPPNEESERNLNYKTV